MVLVLSYNILSSNYLSEIIEESNSPYCYSLSEGQIIKADKIILPHPDNFDYAYRHLQMYNLFSALRLVKKPILGINDGFRMMCNKILSKKRFGLGFFDLDCANLIAENDVPDFYSDRIISETKSKLTNNLNDDTNLVFSPENQTRINKYTKSKVSCMGDTFSLTKENKNYFGVELDFTANQTIGNTIIKNFLKL
jgi:imidazoleglycerol phosphate synthase glutamine amidotransferase subunit HisH